MHEIKARIHETKGRHFQKFTKDIHEMIAIRPIKLTTPRNITEILLKFALNITITLVIIS
jgi:hypothetical protein